MKILADILVMGIMTVVSGQDPREIVKKSHDVVKVSSFEAVSTLTITDARGNMRIRKNTMASMSMPDRTEKRIIRFLSPSEVRGTGILIFDYADRRDDMWIYLPAMRKTRRIVSRERSKSFMGSEFSNANMTAPGLDDFSYELQGEETINGKASYKIQAKPLSTDLEDEYGYSRSVLWIDKINYIVHQTEYYDFDGVLFKTITNRAFKKLDEEGNKFMITSMLAENHSNRRSSEMIMDKVSVTIPNKSNFTVATLEKE